MPGLESLLREERVFQPPQELVENPTLSSSWKSTVLRMKKSCGWKAT